MAVFKERIYIIITTTHQLQPLFLASCFKNIHSFILYSRSRRSPNFQLRQYRWTQNTLPRSPIHRLRCCLAGWRTFIVIRETTLSNHTPSLIRIFIRRPIVKVRVVPTITQGISPPWYKKGRIWEEPINFDACMQCTEGMWLRVCPAPGGSNKELVALMIVSYLACDAMQLGTCACH